MQSRHSVLGDKTQLPPDLNMILTCVPSTSSLAPAKGMVAKVSKPSTIRYPPRRLRILPTVFTDTPAQCAVMDRRIDMGSFIQLVRISSPRLFPSEFMFVLLAMDSGVRRAVELALKFGYKYKRTLKTLERIWRNKQECNPLSVIPAARQSPKRDLKRPLASQG